jgi:hypothetical protein
MRPRRLVAADGRWRPDFGKMKLVESDETLGARGRFRLGHAAGARAWPAAAKRSGRVSEKRPLIDR